MSPPVALSTASVFPETVHAGFALARELGYDGVELMVWSERLSQDVAAVGRLAEASGVPVLAVHAPCLAVTQRVWTADPVERLRRAVGGEHQPLALGQQRVDRVEQFLRRCRVVPQTRRRGLRHLVQRTLVCSRSFGQESPPELP